MNARQKPSPAGLVMAVLNGIGAVLILLMTALICADILARNLFGQPVAGVAELVSLAIVAVVFLQLGQAVRADALTRAELLTAMLKKSAPRVESLLQALYALTAALLFAALVYGVCLKLIDAWRSDEHVGVYGLFVAPVWPVYATVALGSLAAAMQFCIHLAVHLARFMDPAGRAGNRPL